MNVKVHNKQGKVICKIEEPLTWKGVLLDFLLGFSPISRRWKNPAKIEEWAREAARWIVDWNTEGHEPSVERGTLMYDSGALCPACLNYSILPEVWSRRKELRGYSCTTESCSMRSVIIPKVLVETIKEEEKEPATPTPKDQI